MALFGKAFELMRRERAMTAAIAVIVILPILFFSLFTTVTIGTRTDCKYKHTIKEDLTKKLVLRWNAGSYKPEVTTVVCGKHKKLEALWAKEKEARKKGDNAAAKEILASIKAVDPTFPGLAAEITEVAGLLGEEPDVSGTGTGQNGTETGQNGTGADNPGTDSTDGQTPPSGDLSGFFPAAINGYQQVKSTNSGQNASRLYQADQAVNPGITFLTVQLDQAGSDAGAKTFINERVKTYYAADARTADIDGTQAYFGTDSQELAVLAYSVGGVVITLELRSAAGSPKDLYAAAVALGKIIP